MMDQISGGLLIDEVFYLLLVCLIVSLEICMIFLIVLQTVSIGYGNKLFYKKHSILISLSLVHFAFTLFFTSVIRSRVGTRWFRFLFLNTISNQTFHMEKQFLDSSSSSSALTIINYLKKRIRLNVYRNLIFNVFHVCSEKKCYSYLFNSLCVFIL